DLENENRKTDAKNLCGGTNRDTIELNGQKITREVVPSPIWIANYPNYQVVTIFGADQPPRSNYLKTLLKDSETKAQIWPMQQG
ncbi:MAG: hypothetical protein Q6K70_01195, partial [Thermostichales cyanobacterium DRC_bins_46]